MVVCQIRYITLIVPWWHFRESLRPKDVKRVTLTNKSVGFSWKKICEFDIKRISWSHRQNSMWHFDTRRGNCAFLTYKSVPTQIYFPAHIGVLFRLAHSSQWTIIPGNLDEKPWRETLFYNPRTCKETRIFTRTPLKIIPFPSMFSSDWIPQTAASDILNQNVWQHSKTFFFHGINKMAVWFNAHIDIIF